jgi:mono/diheme cytochrome c family protein
VYTLSCAPCHGRDGAGDGSIATFVAPYRAPAPRDFSMGRYKLRSTPSGSVPTDADLLRTITRGIPRYMQGFAALDESVRRGLVEHVKAFSNRFAGPTPMPVEIPSPPARSADAVSRGARTYEDLGCLACHGAHGRGDGPAASALRDTSGRPLPPTDLAQPTWFKGGSSPTDLYRTLLTGFDGTPMPGYADVFLDMEPDAPWNLIAFIESLSAHSGDRTVTPTHD